MINRLLTLVLFGMLSTACFAAEDPDVLLKAAEQALQRGDLEGALAEYMLLVEQNPEDADALEWVASIATEMDMAELAIEVWIQRADLAVTVTSDARVFVQIAPRDGQRRHVAHEDFLGRLAGQVGDLAFQISTGCTRRPTPST